MINGDRVRQAREIAGLTQEELADKVASQSTIAQIENGTPSLFDVSEAIVETIALKTKFPPAFFYQESAPDFPLGSLLYRNRRSVIKKEDRGRFHQLGRLIYELAEKMSDQLSVPDIRIPRIGAESPSIAAQIMRSKLGLSPDAPVKNLINLLEKNGVFVFTLPYQIEEQDAFSVWADTEPRRPVVVLCGIKPGDRQRFSVAHELGHIAMHFSFPKGLKEVEKEADAFAGEFLLPAIAMHREMIAPITLTTLATLKVRWGVSMAALLYRARSLEVISERQWKYLNKQLRDEGWSKEEPANLYIKPEKPRALKKMAEVLFGVPANATKIAALNCSPVSLVEDVLEVHAERPDMPRTETMLPIERQDNVIEGKFRNR